MFNFAGNEIICMHLQNKFVNAQHGQESFKDDQVEQLTWNKCAKNIPASSKEYE